ncbi:PIN domain-containing protein [Candidatus Woesearchaeota archaeon]|nr:PIN domain-containing protein [Candidatus Woesearchaeota archaeon]
MKQEEPISLVIDTDLFIDNLRDFKKSTEWFDAVVKSDKFELYYSALTEAEILAGKACEDKENEDKAIAFLSIGKKVLVTNELARRGGALRRVYGLSIVDAIIAATALQVNAVLCTRNISDYARIQNLKVKAPY